MDMAMQAHLRLIFICAAQEPDWKTARADARAALCLAHGVPIEFISPLGYDITDRSYHSVRAGWLHHIGQWGHHLPWTGRPEDAQVAIAHGYWLVSRPDLATGDDWLAAGIAVHLARYPEGCGELMSCTLHNDHEEALGDGRYPQDTACADVRTGCAA